MTVSNLFNRTQKPVVLLCAVLVSILALVSHPFIPKKRFLAVPSEGGFDLASINLPNGKPAGEWTSENQQEFSCLYPEGYDNPEYYCSWNRRFGWDRAGFDLSSFHTINLKINYTGAATKLRIFARNFNPAYSSIKDFNSTKYNAVFIPVSDLSEEISLSMNEFSVAEWWLLLYKVPRAMAAPELDNIVTLGVDFSFPMTTGLHQVKVEKIELVGDRVSEGTWYLAILSLWLFGIFTYQLNQLRLSRKQQEEDTKLIVSLNHHNKHLKEQSSKFRRLSTVDPLTQTYNRFGIDQVVNSLTAARENLKTHSEMPLFCLVLIDIDHFKKVNDNYGHDTGDLVLQTVSSTIQELLRSHDYLGRWGGEEFLIIMPRTAIHTAFDTAERIRIILAGKDIVAASTSLQVTVSLGVSTCGDGDFATAFKRADEALYHAKRSGRNQVIIAD